MPLFRFLVVNVVVTCISTIAFSFFLQNFTFLYTSYVATSSHTFSSSYHILNSIALNSHS